MTPTAVRVAVARPYDVVIGRGIAESAVARALGGERSAVAIIHQPTVAETARRIACAVPARTTLIQARDGESAKSLQNAAALWDGLAATGITRTDAVVAVGGGALTDVVGFVASTWLRGVDVLHVPSTLLGMADAAVGGKTALNTRAGKNLVGTFHQPLAVVCDLDLLASLDERRIAEGAAEIAKCGFIADPQILTLLESGGGVGLQSHLEELLTRAITVKAGVVSADPGEAGLRETLNYGHTLGHAIERVEDFRVAHGEAVAIGMVFAAEVSAAVTGLDSGTVERHRSLLTRLGLPTRYKPDAWTRLLDVMRADKKTRGQTLRMVLLEEVGHPVVQATHEMLLEAAYRKVSE